MAEKSAKSSVLRSSFWRVVADGCISLLFSLFKRVYQRGKKL
jgi:hypothetical protein